MKSKLQSTTGIEERCTFCHKTPFDAFIGYGNICLFHFWHIFICSTFLYWSNNCKNRTFVLLLQYGTRMLVECLYWFFSQKKLRVKCANSWANENSMPEKLSSLFELYIKRLKVIVSECRGKMTRFGLFVLRLCTLHWQICLCLLFIQPLCYYCSIWFLFFFLPFLLICFVSVIFREKSQRVYRLGLRTTLVMVLAITCWVLDKFFCDTYLGQKFPYLHAIWHVLIFISSYTACVLFAYYAVKEEHVNHIPDLRYWPVNDFELGIPFVSIKCYYSEEKRNI